MRTCAGLVAIAVVLGATGRAPRRAGADDLPHDRRHPDRIAAPHYQRDLPLVAVTAALYLAGETVAKDALSPDTCRWCGANGLDDGVRDGLVWADPALANTVSNLVGYAAVPIVALGGLELAAHLDGRRDDWFHNGLIVVQAALLSADLNYLVKIGVARERPFVHQLAADDKPRTTRPAENNLSFYSGHAALAMSLAVAAGTTATLRGYRHHRLVWATTVPLALATGYLRIGADKHWTTDVVTGWVAGAAFGFAVPYFLHRRRTPTSPVPILTRTATTTTAGLALTW